MIKNLKCRLTDFFSCRQVRIGGLAVFTALTIIAATLYGRPFHTEQRLYNLNKMSANVNPIVASRKLFNTESTKAQKTSPAYPVYITCGEETLTVDFTGGTVADALTLAGFTIDSLDFVEPALDTKITETVYIDYTDIDYMSGTYTKTIKYDTKIIYTNKYTKGYDAVTTQGVDGVTEVSYIEKFVNGVSAEKTVTETKVLSNPVDMVKVVGTKEPSPVAVNNSSAVKSISVLAPAKEIALDANGNPVNYKSKKTVRATAYTHTGNNCSTGVAPKPGYIAVNPNEIPYGTKLYIKSPDGKIVYGYAIAADTGGFVRNHPTGIDLFMDTASACTAFGVRNMEIFILE